MGLKVAERRLRNCHGRRSLAIDILAKALQAALTAVLIGAALRWAQRSSARRRDLVRDEAGRALLVYPRWVTWLGIACALGFGLCAWLAWDARTGGPAVSSIFIAFSVLGVVVLLAAWGEVYLVDDGGIERRRFGHSRSLRWDRLVRVSAPGPGLRLVADDGTRLDCPEMLDGFGVLCDRLLLHAPRSLRADPASSNMVLAASTLAPEPLHHAYARWFEREECTPPPELTPADLAEAAGVALAARLLERQGTLLPFESRWTQAGMLDITHGEPDRDDPNARYELGFGAHATDPTAFDLEEPLRFLGLCQGLGIELINQTLSSRCRCGHQ